MPEKIKEKEKIGSYDSKINLTRSSVFGPVTNDLILDGCTYCNNISEAKRLNQGLKMQAFSCSDSKNYIFSDLVKYLK